MAFKIRLKRGLSTRFGSVKLEKGEPAFLIDSGKLYIGNGEDNILINPDKVEKSEITEKLAKDVTITLEGDVSADFSFDGTANKYVDVELKDVGKSGTYSKVEIDNKGRVIKGEALSENDIPNLSVRKISDAGTAARRDIGTESGNIPVIGADGKLSSLILPPLAISDIFTIDSESSMLALFAERGDVAIRTDINKTFILSTGEPGIAESWKEILTPMEGVQSINGQSGAVSMTYFDIGAAAEKHFHDDNEIETSFDETDLRENITSGDKLSIVLSKVSKWLADLKDVAFSGSYKDLSDTPPTELENIGEEGTYIKVTTDKKGRVIKGATLTEADIPKLQLDKISDIGSAASKDIGTASGNIPILGADGKLSAHVLPPIAISEIFTVDNEESMLGLSAERGDVAVRTDLNKTFILSKDNPEVFENWTEILTPTGAVQSVNGQTGVVSLTYTDVEAAANIHSHNDSDIITTFEEADLMENITTGEKLSSILGKIAKWFAALNPIAFSGSYKDLSDTPESYTHPLDDGNLHVPATGTGNNGKVLTAGSKAGSFSWQTLSITASNAKPKMNGTAAEGTEQKYSRADHIHPTDTTRASTNLATKTTAGLMSPEDKEALEELKKLLLNQ